MKKTLRYLNFEIPNHPQMDTMTQMQDEDQSESSDKEVGASTLNHNAAPYVPQRSEAEQVTNEDQDMRSPDQDLRATTNVLRPTMPEPIYPRRHLHMVKAHTPTQMLSSVTEGVRNRSSNETLLANHAFVSL